MTATERCRAARAARVAKGLCWFCLRPALPGSKHCCLVHLRYLRLRSRSKSGNQAWSPGGRGRPPIEAVTQGIVREEPSA
jgi:hypothetical protein